MTLRRTAGRWAAGDNFADGAPAPSVTGEGDMSGLDTLGDFHPQAPNGSGTRRWQGGAASSRRRPRAEESPGDVEADRREMRQAAMSMGDRDLVSHEIWFVFTGASEAQHTGMKAFLKKYAKHLRGAYFINLECVGSGRQSLVIEEGTFQAPQGRPSSGQPVRQGLDRHQQAACPHAHAVVVTPRRPWP